MSYDGINATEPLAITAAGVTLALSDMSFAKPVVGVRVGWLNGPVVNPTAKQQEQSTLDLVLAGTSDGIVMLEANVEFIKDKNLFKVKGGVFGWHLELTGDGVRCWRQGSSTSRWYARS